MRALLLAGGLGTRLRPVTDTVPKCLVPIGGRALLDYWIERLLEDGFERILVNTHYLADVVHRHLDASPWRDHVDLVHETALLGTGGTVHANRAWFGSGSFLVAHADNATTADFAALAKAHEARAADVAITMLAFHTDDPRSCGILDLDRKNRVVAFHEKVAEPPGTLANGAVYMLAPEVLQTISALARTVIDLSTEVIPRFLGRIEAVIHDGYHRDIGTMASLTRAEAEFPSEFAAARNARGRRDTPMRGECACADLAPRLGSESLRRHD